MQMIGLSTVTYNIAGFFIMHPEAQSTSHLFEKRISRTPTLDGGASIIDLGYSEQDRRFTFVLKKDITEILVEDLSNVMKYEDKLRLSTVEGFFTVHPESFKFVRGVITFTLLAGDS